LSLVARRPVSEVATYRMAVVEPQAPVERVRRIMRDYGYRLLAVVDRDGRLLGVIGRSEVLLVSSTKSEALASSIMVEPPVVLEGSILVGDAVKKMLAVDEWYAPIVEGRIFKSIFGLEDVIEWALKSEADRRILERTRLEEVMSRNPLTVTPEDTIDKVWRLMTEYRYAGIPVVDSKGVVVGMITQYDLLKKGYARPHLEAERGPGRRPRVRTAMTRPCTYLYTWSTLLEAATIMVNRNVGRIPVVESETTRKLVGIVDREDVVRALLSY